MGIVTGGALVTQCCNGTGKKLLVRSVKSEINSKLYGELHWVSNFLGFHFNCFVIKLVDRPPSQGFYISDRFPVELSVFRFGRVTVPTDNTQYWRDCSFISLFLPSSARRRLR